MAAQQKRKSVDVDEIAAAPVTCANGCGFFSNPATGGMCSKCYRDPAAAAAAATAGGGEKKMKAQAAFNASGGGGGGVFAPAPRAPPEKKARMTCAAAVAPSPDGGVADDAATAAGPAKPAAAANRCTACRKKVGLLGFGCCCGETFCGAHRYAEKHGCSFDYKRAGRDRIAKNNPVVVADKIAKI